MRPMNEIIVHCSATPEGRPVTVKEIDAWHRARGWSGIGYHFVIHLDGRVEAGRPIGRIGAHVAGHNTGTIGIVYIGGLDRAGDTPKDTRTAKQKEALTARLIALRDRYGIQKVSGHNEYAPKACPSFDASADYDHLFPEGRAVPPIVDEILERGDRGPAVRQWRADLDAYRAKIGHPYRVPEGDRFDHTIELVTRWFQKERGILVDGRVGPQTRDEMDRALAGKPPYQALADDPPADVDESRPAVAVGSLAALIRALIAVFRRG